MQATRIRPDTRPTDLRRLAAAALSAVIPGLGQLFNRRPALAMLFLIPSLVVLVVGLFVVQLQSPARLAAWAVSPQVLSALLALNVIALVWRLVAVVPGLPRHPPDGADRLAGHRRPSRHRPRRGDPAPGRLPHRHGPRRHVRQDLRRRGPRRHGRSGATDGPVPGNGQRINVLLVGIDKRGDRASNLTDTMMVASLDPVGRTVSLLSLPRDLIDTPLGNGDIFGPKLNSLMSYADRNPKQFPKGGMRTLEDAAGALLEIPIHYYARLDFRGLIKMVDAVGGVDIVAPRAFQDPGLRRLRPRTARTSRSPPASTTSTAPTPWPTPDRARRSARATSPLRRHADDRLDRRRQQDPAVRHQGDAAPPRARRARARDRPRPVRRRPRVRPHRGDRAAAAASTATARSSHDALAAVRAGAGVPLRCVCAGPEARHRPPRLRRVLRDGRADAAPGADGQAGDRRRLRPAGGGHDRVATRRASSASARRCRPRARAGCARTRSSSRPTSPPTARSRARSGSSSRERLDRVQQIGHRRGVRRPDRRREAAARAARAGRRRSRRRPGSRSRSGVGPSRLVAKCCSDLGKPAGFVAMGREEACVRFATAPTQPRARHRPEDRRAAGRARLRAPSASSRRPTRRSSPRASATASARYLKARAAFEDDSPVETERRVAKSVSTERTFDDRRRRPRRELEDDPARALARALRGAADASGRRGRTIAIKVRLDDWTTVTRARTLDGADQRHRSS